MPARKRIIVTGFMGSCPIAGVVWQHIHFIVGLLRLGHDVYYIEDSEDDFYNPATLDWSSDDFSHVAKTLEALAKKYGFQDHWAFRARALPGLPTAGLSSERIRDLYWEADAILNVCGAQALNEDLLRSDRLIYVESDPVLVQVKVDMGDQDTIECLRSHKAWFTFGELVPTPEFPVPLHGFDWKPTRQPIVTDLWSTDQPLQREPLFTTVANWSTSGERKDVEWRGDTYLWSKSLEFLRFIDAPAALKFPVELATDIPDDSVRADFLSKGWKLTSPHDLSSDFDQYQRYIQSSGGEFTVAKDQYVRLRTGWFSDRSACYLAAGRPVVTQETGFTQLHGIEDGLFGFTSLAEIEAAAEKIRQDYAGQCRAASDVACELFEATRVLEKLLAEAGV